MGHGRPNQRGRGFDRESFVALTAHVVDLDARLDSRTRGMLEGGVPVGEKQGIR